MPSRKTRPSTRRLTVASLFAGGGGWEVGAVPPMLRVLLVSVLLVGCAPLQCKTLSVDVYGNGKPRAAGRLLVRCDGRAIIEAEAATLTVGAP